MHADPAGKMVYAPPTNHLAGKGTGNNRPVNRSTVLVHLAGYDDSLAPVHGTRTLIARHIAKGFKPPARCTSVPMVPGSILMASG
jgi:hypothetical protein